MDDHSLVSSLPKCGDVDDDHSHYDAIESHCNLRIYCRNVRLGLLLFHIHVKDEDTVYSETSNNSLIEDINEKIKEVLKLFCQLDIPCLNGMDTVRKYLPIHCIARELRTCFEFSYDWMTGEQKPICKEAVRLNNRNKCLFRNCMYSFIKAGANPHAKTDPCVPIFKAQTAFDIILK